MSTNNSRGSSLLRDQKLIAGAEKNLASYRSLTVGTRKVTPSEIVASLQHRLAKAEATARALSAYRAAVKDEIDERAKSAKLIAGFTRLIEGMFFDAPTLLADFGLKPVSRARRTVAQKAAAVEKAKATREARHPKIEKPTTVVSGTTPATPVTPLVHE